MKILLFFFRPPTLFPCFLLAFGRGILGWWKRQGVVEPVPHCPSVNDNRFPPALANIRELRGVLSAHAHALEAIQGRASASHSDSPSCEAGAERGPSFGKGPFSPPLWAAKRRIAAGLG